MAEGNPERGGRRAGRARAWLELVRFPNLFTVPGDPLAGLFLSGGASGAAALAAVPAALALYAAGCVANDVADRAEDARERPGRPIPSGRVVPAAALAAALALGAAGVAAAFLLGGRDAGAVAAGLAAAIALYTIAAKRSVFWGPLVMGLCRGLSVLLGAAAGGGMAGPGGWLALGGAVVTGVAVAAVTVVARRETAPGAVGPVRWAPEGVAFAGSVGLGVAAAGLGLWAFVTWLAFAGAWTGWWARVGLSLGRGAPVPPAIGQFIRGLLLLQAGQIAWGAGPGLWVAVALVALCGPAHAGLSRRFAPS